MATNSAQDERNAQAIIEGIGKVWSRKLGVLGGCAYFVSGVDIPTELTWQSVAVYALQVLPIFGLGAVYMHAQGRVDAAKAGGGFILVDDSESDEQDEASTAPPRSAN